MCRLLVIRIWMLGAVGKATVISDLGEGQYSVSLDYGTAWRDWKISRLNAIIASLDVSISDEDAVIGDIQSQIDNAVSALNAAISALASATTDADRRAARSDINRHTIQAQELNARKQQMSFDLSSKKIQRSNAAKKKSDLESIIVTDTREVWCATYTEDAAGEVGTIEINGEQPTILIAPDAPASENYGSLRHRMLMSPSAAYYNASVLPGWQKWMPTYRVGVVSNINYDDDIATVDLDAATSSAQALDINQQPTRLTNVPIEYLECNSSPFENGDRVVVQFQLQDWQQPKIIGFESNPKPCGRWLWLGANKVDKRLTAKVHPDTLVVQQEWATDVLDTYEISRDGLDEPLSLQAARRILDPVTGAVSWSADYFVPTGAGNSFTFAVNKRANRMFLYGPVVTRAFALYNWREGTFITQCVDPCVAQYGQTTNNAARLALNSTKAFAVSSVGLDGFAGNHIAASLYDLDGNQVWNYPYGTGGAMFAPPGCAASDKWLAMLLLSEATLQAVVLDLNGTVQQTVNLGYPSGSIAEDVAIRGDSLYVLSRNFYIEGSILLYQVTTNYTISKYSILNGGLISTRTGVWSSLFSGTDSVSGDTGSID